MRHSRDFLSLISALPMVALMGHGTASFSPPAAAPKDKVLICHNAGPSKQIELEVDDDAVPAHVAQHGDTIGACDAGGGGEDT